jgi:proline iminopeptidase
MHARINQTELFYTTVGQGRPMLIMHGGLGLDHTYFRPWLDPLGERVQLVYYDHRGNGRSQRPASFDGIGHDTWAADADALRAYLGHERMILFGHSYGGFLAQEYALCYGQHLDGLILSCTAPALDYPEVIRANSVARAGTPEQVDTVNRFLQGEPMASDEALAEALHVILPFYFKHYDPEVGKEIGKSIHYSAAASNHVFSTCIPSFNTLPRLSEIAVPTLVIAGRDDWITPPREGAERIHDALPDSEIVIFEDSGHFPFIEEQAKFLTIVGQWIGSLGGRHRKTA